MHTLPDMDMKRLCADTIDYLKFTIAAPSNRGDVDRKGPRRGESIGEGDQKICG